VALDRETPHVTAGRRLLLLAPSAVLLLAALLPVSFSTPFPLCAVKGLTGADCPGCGMTRAFLLIAHGRVAEAAALHPLSPLAFLVVGGMAAAGIVRALGGRSRAPIPLDPPLPKGEL
jgi:di/tricarboxylate transporter